MATEVVATQRPGNTIQAVETYVAKKARAYLLTLNEIERYPELRSYLSGYKSMDYFIAAKEKAPTTGHEHIHIYVHFCSPIKLNIKKCEGAHIDICRGSPKQNIDYVSKDGEIIEEVGNKPRQGMATIAEVEGMTTEDRKQLPIQYANIVKKMNDEDSEKQKFFEMLGEIKENRLQGPEIIYITGPSGNGKTYYGYKLATEKFPIEKIGKLTLSNDFFSIVNKDAECFVIEEFRTYQIKASAFLQLTDKYGYNANTKGGFCMLRPKMIIICSIEHPNELYKNEEVNSQFMRRITKIIKMNRYGEAYVSYEKNSEKELDLPSDYIDTANPASPWLI